MRFALAVVTIVASLAGAPPPRPADLVTIRPGRTPSRAQPARQQAARDTKPVQPQGSGVLRGRVLSLDTHEPLRHAFISVWADPIVTRGFDTLTDLEGRFELTQVPAGRYRLSAAKNRYLGLEYGQRSAREPGKPIVLADGHTLGGLDFLLPPCGVIAGTVVDDLGEPVERAVVTVLQRRFVNGERRLVPVPQLHPENAQPNDLGRYRIYGLPPGTYYVGAMPLRPIAATDDGVSFAPTYYHSTTDIAQAEPIALKLRQQRLDVDVVLMAARPARVSGMVVSSLGQPVANAAVTSSQMIADQSYSSYAGPHGTTRADGTFTLSGMRPGVHTLGVDAVNPQTGENEHGRVAVNVAGADIDAVVLATLANVSVAGRIRLVPGLTARFPSSKLSVMSYPTTVGLVRTATSVSVVRTAPATATPPEWTFALRGIAPGPSRRFTVMDLPQAWRVAGVFCKGRDITDGTDVTPGQNLSDVEIWLTNTTTEITCLVTDADGRQTTDFTVVIFSEDASRWVEGSRSVVSVRPDQNGGVTVRNLRAGGYFVIALDYLQEGDEYDPDVLRGLQVSATRITIKDGETKSLDLHVARIDR
jgi:hypothetical protein